MPNSVNKWLNKYKEISKIHIYMNTGLIHSLLLMRARNEYKYNRGRQAWDEENLLIWRELSSLAGRGQPRWILTSWKKQIIVPFRIRLFCITFSGPVLSYPVPKKGRGYPVPGACVWRGRVGSGWGNVPTGLSSAGKWSGKGPLQPLGDWLGKCWLGGRDSRAH